MKGVMNDLRLSNFVLLGFSFIFCLYGANAVAIAEVTVNVKNDLVSLGIYGRNVAGDGETNDDVPINAAIDYVIAQGGGTVFCPAGTYRVERIFVDDNSVNFIGDGKDLTFFRPHPDNTTSRLFDFRGGSIRDFTIYGTFPEDSGENWVCGGHCGCSHGILANNIASKSIIKNVRVLEIKGFALYSRDCSGLWVVDCEFDKAESIIVMDPIDGNGINENFVFANCKFGPYRSKYLFDIEPTEDEYVRNGVILNCEFNGTDSGDYGTNTNLWGCFLGFKGFYNSGERRNVAVVGCKFNDVYIYINRVFPDVQFTCNKVDVDTPVFSRPSYANVGEFPNTVVRGNHFVGKKHRNQIISDVNFPGTSCFSFNTPSVIDCNGSSHWPDCNAADIKLLNSVTNIENFDFDDLMHLCTYCPRELLSRFCKDYKN